MSRIILQGMRFHAYHGTRPYEREVPQEFRVDVDLTGDFSVAERSDALADALDYTRVYATVRGIITTRRFNLLEALARAIADALLSGFERISEARVRVRKMQPPLNGVGSVAVEVTVNREA